MRVCVDGTNPVADLKPGVIAYKAHLACKFAARNVWIRRDAEIKITT